jgi:uric acid transporter
MSTRAVDEMLPPGKLAAFGLQHVLVMYAGAIAVPFIIGGALKLSQEQIAFLISADLFCCGIVTIIQSLGIGPLGIRMPVMMGVTFAAVPAMLAMVGTGGTAALPGIYGAIIAAGVVCTLLSPIFGRLIHLFPAVVTGTVILVIGISLARIGINWAAGAPAPTIPGYGSPENIGLAAFVLVAILVMSRYLTGFMKNIAVLLGLIIGCIAAFAMGKMNFARVEKASWFEFITPFSFGTPTFDLAAIISLSIVMLIVMVETTGMLLAVGDMVGEKVDEKRLTSGLAVDGVGTIIGGVFNTFPYVSYSQNVGLVGVTGIKSRYVTVAAGVILIILGLIPKIGAIAASIPTPVLGGAGLVMFGMIAATGVKILGSVDFNNRDNLFIVAISLTVGLIPLVAPTFFNLLPAWIKSISHSGITLTAIFAVALNIFFNGFGKKA